MMILTWLKDALLCLLICTTLANIGKNKKTAFVSMGMIFVFILMGIDM